MSSTINPYEVLGLSNTCSQEDIRRARNKLMKKYHPDKKNGDAKTCQLIMRAYNRLSNPEYRAEYDKIQNLLQQSNNNFFQLRENYRNYNKARETDITQLSKEDSNIQFNKIYKEMDSKHNFKRKTYKDELANPLNGRQTNERYNDLQTTRENDDIEDLQDEILDKNKEELSYE